ncbi:Complex 1 LYR protein [Arabidopsis suecica]|nr:Complex 1 LYR protein [Arabidopsis suecica]
MLSSIVVVVTRIENFQCCCLRDMMAAKLQKWRNLAGRLDLMNRSGAVSTRRFLHEGPDTVEELLERHLAKKEKPIIDHDEAEFLNRRRLTSTRREALSLYRDILRATRFFTWIDSRGNLWRDVLRENARKEFEAARFETDPEVITRLLIGGSDAVSSALDKLAEKQREMIEKQRRGDQR